MSPDHHDAEFVPKAASEEQARNAKLPLGYRDQCGALLIPLNVCRHKTLYATWKCDDERHAYDKCQYDDYISRMKALTKQAEKQAA